MPSISFSKFDLGIDLRKGASVSDANRLREMKNAFVTTGLATQKRPGLTKVADLEPGTKGLFAALGKLNTFYGTGAISHANPLFKANKVRFSGGEQAVVDVPFADIFNGFIYCASTYAGGATEHHYLDTFPVWTANAALGIGAGRSPVAGGDFRHFVTAVNVGVSVWVPSTVYAIGAIRRPIVDNGLRYECTSNTTGVPKWVPYMEPNVGDVVCPTVPNGFYYRCTTKGTGSAGFIEPTWPVVEFATVQGGNNYVWSCEAAAKSGATEPIWPTGDGATVTDGLLTWVCRATATTGATEPAWPTVFGATIESGFLRWSTQTTGIADANCPDTEVAIKLASKIFAVGANGDVVRYCKTGNPRDWTAANDAGFLPTGLNSRGDRNVNALGMYQSNLVALNKDSAQVWTVDPDPNKMALNDVVENVGTSFAKSVANVSGDLYFLSDYGVRSITTLQYTNSLADADVGSPIDALVRAETSKAGVKPKSFYFYGTGQYVCAIGNRLFVYSISRTAKIAAWSQYFLSVPVDDFAELGQKLYIRSGDAVYQLDEDATTDDGTAFEVVLEMPYMDFKSPGQLKMITGMDAIVGGTCLISVGFDVRDPSAFTPEFEASGNTRPGGMLPVECAGTEFTLRFRTFDDQPFRLDAVTIYYEILGHM